MWTRRTATATRPAVPPTPADRPGFGPGTEDGQGTGGRAASQLRRILEEINGAHEAVSLDEIAGRIGVTRDEADATVAYWVRKGRLSSDDLTAACPSGGCGTCPSGDNGNPGCGTRRNGPVLLAITRRPTA